MKKILYFLSIFTLISSCSALDKEPLDVYTKEVITQEGQNNGEGVKYTTKEQAVTLLQSCYTELRSEYFQFDQFQLQETLSDNAYAGGNDIPTINLDYYTYDALNTVTARDWGYLYGAIAKTNTFITHVPNITDLAFSVVEKNRMVGEAKFLRAYFYFLMTNYWGDVPLVLEEAPTITADNVEKVHALLYPPRTAQSEVYNQIVKDLTDALQSVADANPLSSDKSIVTKGTVNGLLAKVYATLKEYDNCIAAAQKVIDAGYTLTPTFRELWDLTNEHSTESLLEVDFTAAAGNWTEWILFDYAKTSTGTLDWQRFCTPAHALITNFESENDNIRLAETVYTGIVSWNVHWPNDNYKFEYKIRNNANNIILLRLADIVLIKAEAHAQKGDFTTAMTLVNQIRNRVGLPAKSATSKENALDIILLERQLELAFECHRWFDLLRYGKTIEIMDKVKDKTNDFVYRGKLSSHRLVLPVPQSEIDKNPNLTQNQGY